MKVEVLSPAPASSFPPDWYDAASSDHFWMAWRLGALLGLVRDLGLPVGAPLRGLDIGCGSGVVAAQIEAATSWTVDCADINAAALALIQGGRGRVMLYDIGDRRPELVGRYDFLLLLDVIEHIENPAPFLAAAVSHVKPRGWVFVNVPALPSLYSAYDKATGHYRRYDRTSLGSELERAGLAVAELRYWGASLLPLLGLRTLILSLKPPRDMIAFGFRPPARWMNGALRGLMRAELALLSRPPIGSSLLAAAQRS
jgi:SAM-dependent methyltransferase